MLCPPDLDVLYSDLWQEIVRDCPDCRGTGYHVDDAPDDLATLRNCACKDLALFRLNQAEANLPNEFSDVEEMKITHNIEQLKKVQEALNDVAGMKKDGTGFVFFGPNGVGKTTFGCLILCKAMRAGYSAAYMTAPELMYAIHRGWRDEELTGWFDNLRKADFLFLDELGKEHKAEGSEYTQAEIDLLIRWRRSNMLPTTIATNYRQTEFRKRYGSSITSVLADRMTYLSFVDGDYRQRKRRRAES